MKSFSTFFFLFLIFSFEMKAQEFEKAPLPKVKTITEWVQDPKNKKVQRGLTYHFSRNGSLSLYTDNPNKKMGEHYGVYKYDKKNRILSKENTYGSNVFTTVYAYKKNYYVEEQSLKDSYYKRFHYVDQDLNVVETKTFIKSYDSNYKFQLFERTVFNYKNGKLVGETHYNHWNLRDKNVKPDKKMTTYSYHKKTGKLLSKNEYDYQKKLNKTTAYNYNSKGELIQKTLDYHNGKMESTTYKYTDEHLWIEKFDEGNIVITKIYKKNRLIRKRKKWEGGKEEIIDFEYKFFK